MLTAWIIVVVRQRIFCRGEIGKFGIEWRLTHGVFCSAGELALALAPILSVLVKSNTRVLGSSSGPTSWGGTFCSDNIKRFSLNRGRIRELLIISETN